VVVCLVVLVGARLVVVVLMRLVDAVPGRVVVVTEAPACVVMLEPPRVVGGSDDELVEVPADDAADVEFVTREAVWSPSRAHPARSAPASARAMIATSVGRKGLPVAGQHDEKDQRRDGPPCAILRKCTAHGDLPRPRSSHIYDVVVEEADPGTVIRCSLSR
jgi:hypothetical protein